MTLDPTLLRAIDLARELPAEVPELAHREQIRAAVLARAEAPVRAPRSRRPHAIAGALAVAAGLAGYLAMRSPDAPAPLAVTTPPAPPIAVATRSELPFAVAIPRAHGHVHPRPGAELATGAANPDEIVRLVDGTIDIDVDPLGPHDRFRVIVGASEIEVRGTSFTVVAERDRLVDVKVAHGRVEVRPAGAAPLVLDAGASWHAPKLAMIAPRPRPEAAPIAVATPADQLAYDDAWTALRGQRFHDAGAAFARALALAPEGPLADDARYWHAVALAREPRAADAIVAFRELLDEHPGTAHRGEASAMLGWLLVDPPAPPFGAAARGRAPVVDGKQLAEARTRFEAAASDPSEKVRASARAGLAALP